MGCRGVDELPRAGLHEHVLRAEELQAGALRVHNLPSHMYLIRASSAKQDEKMLLKVDICRSRDVEKR